MDDSLYDEFGNYLGPDLDEEEDEEMMEEEEEEDDYGLGEQYVEEEVDQEDQQDTGMQLMHIDGRNDTGYGRTVCFVITNTVDLTRNSISLL